MKKIIVTEKAPKAIGPYSQAVEHDKTLYLSGQIPINPATSQLVGGGIVEQTEQVLKNIGSVLMSAGYNYSDVVKTTVLMTDLGKFKEMNEVYARFFEKDPPARATYQVVALPLGSMIEIETIAVKNDKFNNSL